jgi:hypothetical protein
MSAAPQEQCLKSGLQIIVLPLGILCCNRESGWKYGGGIVRKLFRDP